MVKVKICGITNGEDALTASGYGADLLGFIFVEDTPRFVPEGRAADIIKQVSKMSGDKVSCAGLFMDADIKYVAQTVAACGLDHVQLHGNESPGYCRELKKTVAGLCGRAVKIIKTFKVKEYGIAEGEHGISSYEEADYLLFDTYSRERPGGTGLFFDPEIISRNKKNIEKPFFIAGGLTPGNVGDVVAKLRPCGVDVSSGVEVSPGKKSKELLKEFISNAKNI